MTEPIVFLNGRMVPASQAHLNIYDLGVVLGATVTEMIRTFGQRPYRLNDHLGRLSRSLRYVQFDIGMPIERLAEITEEVARRNVAMIGPDEELGLIVFVTAGEHRVYAGSAGDGARQSPTVCVHTFPLLFHLWAEKVRRGAHVVTPSIRNVPPQCIDPKVKYRSRMHYYLAEQQAHLVDPDAMPLLLDLRGSITETSTSNFLIVEHGTLVSPPLTNILPGISRQIVIELASDLSIPFVERDFQVFDVINADEALSVSTPYCIMPVTRVNGLPIGDGEPGPMFRRIVDAWSREVGVDIVEQVTGAACEDGPRRSS